uniref:Uncharacterized protein n=1 Tax=Knipowitschia caucasica TaxID=637954 RepID=A0AAV2JHW4_KNICA
MKRVFQSSQSALPSRSGRPPPCPSLCISGHTHIHKAISLSLNQNCHSPGGTKGLVVYRYPPPVTLVLNVTGESIPWARLCSLDFEHRSMGQTWTSCAEVCVWRGGGWARWLV